MKKSSLILGSFMALGLTVTGVYAALSDVPANHWAKTAVDNLTTAQVLKGYPDGTFKGDQNITRYEAAVVVDKNNAVWMKKMADMEKAMMDKMTAMETKMAEMEKMMDEWEMKMDEMMDEEMESKMYTAALDGAQEVPAVNTNAKGTASFELVGNKLTYEITVSDLSGPVTSAHIHLGKKGEEGDPVHTLTFTDNKATGSWTMTDAELKNLAEEMYYVNVHTAANPEGEIRGQVMPKA